MSTELMTELLEAGVHFGHQTKRWNPKMKPFIFEKRSSIYIIDLSVTVQQLQSAAAFLTEVAQNGKKVYVAEAVDGTWYTTGDPAGYLQAQIKFSEINQ